MSTPQLLTTIRNQDQQIRRLRVELQSRSSVNYEDKYKKALKSIEEIIKANKQIKEQLDALRMMRQNEMQTLNQFQKQQFKKAYDAILKEKNSLVISLQSLELQNQKLKYTVSELQNQISLLKNDKIHRNHSEKEINSHTYPTQALGFVTNQNSPRKSQNKDLSQLLRQKEDEFHRTLENYEEHHANLTRTNKRLDERITQLQKKLITNEKMWRNKLEAKQLQVIDVKAFTRQEFTDQISALRKQNASLKLASNDLLLKLQTAQKSGSQQIPYQNFDWEADLVQQMIAVKANLQPLRHQISELQELNIYEKQQSIREKTNLRTQALQLESEVQRQKQTIKSMEKKIMESHQQKTALQQRANQAKKLEEENQLLNGKVIVMQSRQIALRNRTGEQLEQRVLQFENRIQLLLNNKQGLKELKEVGIHQLLALKAYIMELDGKLKQLVNSNAYVTKKYKSYKQKYQGSLKEHKQYEFSINSLKMKILGYDKLVLKLQEELECALRSSDHEINQTYVRPQFDQNSEIYKKKYELMREKLQIQQKYKQQEIETLRLSYETRIMELTIKAQQIRSLKETLELYRSKNEELQQIVNKKESELYQSKMTSSKAAASVQIEQYANNRQTKDIINSLHLTIKQNDQKYFKLQSQLRSKEDTYKRTILKLERDIQDLRQEHGRQSSKREVEKSLSFEQQIKKYKLKTNDLEHELHLLQASNKQQHNKASGDFEAKLRRLQIRVKQVENEREQEIFNKRRLEKQILDLTRDKQQLQRSLSQLQQKSSQIDQLKRDNQNLRSRQSSSSYAYKSEPKAGYSQYDMQSKQNMIRKLNNQIIELKSSLGEYSDKDIAIGSLKNEVFYLKKEVGQLNDTINKYNNEILFLKGNLDANRTNYNSGLQELIEEKDSMLLKVRKQLSNKELKIRQTQDQVTSLQQTIRKLRRQLSEGEYLKQQLQRMQRSMGQRDSNHQRLKMDLFGYEQEIERYKKQNNFIKENYQKLNYLLLEKQDQISRLGLELNTVALRNKDQYENRMNEELLTREKQYNKLNSQYLALKSTLTMLEEDKNYHQQNYRRTNNELLNLRNLINELQEQKAALQNQLYFKSQQVNKFQFNIQNYEADINEYTQKLEQLNKMRNQLFTLRNQNSSMQDQIYNKQSNYSRVVKELSYVRQQYSQLQEQHNFKSDGINKLNYELSALRTGFQEAESSLQQRDTIISRLNADLTTYKNKYRELEEEMEERQQEFTNISQQISQMRTNLAYYQDDIQDKKTQMVRLTNERETLRAQIVRLNEEVTQKNMEINRSKQQYFSLKLELNQGDYQKQMKFQQQINAYKNRLAQFENVLEDKQVELRRMNIQLETSRYKPAPVGQTFTQEEVQELRNQINKKQRDLVNMKFDLEDKQFIIQSANNTMTMLKNTVSELQQTLEGQRGEYQSAVRDFFLKERKYNDCISQLQQQISRLQAQTQRQRSKSYAITYSEEEMSAMQQKVSQKKNELIQLKSKFTQQQFYVQNLASKLKMQEKLIKELQEQNFQDRSRAQMEIQESIKRERAYREQISQIQQSFQVKVYQFEKYHQQNLYQINASENQKTDYNAIIKAHVEEIDRLTRIVKDLEEEIYSFKLKLSSMINQQTRIQENLVTMVLLFSECEALRDRIKLKQSEINEVRKSFIQMTVAGELEPNKMSRLISLANKGEENIEFSSSQKSQVSLPKQFQAAPFQQFVENNRVKSQPTTVFEKMQQSFNKNASHNIVQYEEQRPQPMLIAPIQYNPYAQYNQQVQNYTQQSSNQRNVQQYEQYQNQGQFYQLHQDSVYGNVQTAQQEHQKVRYYQDNQEYPRNEEYYQHQPQQVQMERQVQEEFQGQEQIQTQQVQFVEESGSAPQTSPGPQRQPQVAPQTSPKEPVEQRSRKIQRSGTIINQLQNYTQSQMRGQAQQIQQIQHLQLQQIQQVQQIQQAQQVQTNQNRGFINIKIQSSSQVAVPQQTASPVPQQIASTVPHQIASSVPQQIASSVPQQIASSVPQQIASSYQRVIHPHLHLQQPLYISNSPPPQMSQVRVLPSSSPQPINHLQRSSHQIYQVSPQPGSLLPGRVIQQHGSIIREGPPKIIGIGSPVNQKHNY